VTKAAWGSHRIRFPFRILLGFGRSFFHLLVREPHRFPGPPESTLPRFSSFMFISLPRVRVCILHMTRVAAEFLLKLKIVKFSHFYLIMLLKHIFSLDISICPLALKKRHEVQAKQNQIPWTGIQQLFCMGRHDDSETFFMFSRGVQSIAGSILCHLMLSRKLIAGETLTTRPDSDSDSSHLCTNMSCHLPLYHIRQSPKS
jgi:hypothetical protein